MAGGNWNLAVLKDAESECEVENIVAHCRSLFPASQKYVQLRSESQRLQWLQRIVTTSESESTIFRGVSYGLGWELIITTSKLTNLVPTIIY